MSQSASFHLAFFIARVPVGTSVSIVVQSSLGVLRAAIAWYTFKPDSLTARDTAFANSAAATTVTATDLDIVTDGVLFSIAVNVTAGTSFSYNGTDSLIANVSNIQIEGAVNTFFSSHHTLTTQTISTNDITATGASEARSILAVSFNTEAFFSDTVAEGVGVAEVTDRTRLTASSASDTWYVADIARDTPITFFSETVSDTVGNSDNATTPVTYPFSIIEAINLLPFTSMTENMGVADTFRVRDLPVYFLSATVAQSIGISHTQAQAVGYRLLENLRTIDSSLLSSRFSLFVLDQNQLSDSAAAARVAVASETVGVAPAASATMCFALVESVGTSDVVSSQLKRVVLVAESGGVRDIVVVGIPRSLSDSVAVSEAIGAVQALRVLERLGIGDTLTPRATYAMAFQESVRLRDALRKFFGGDVVDGVATTDVLSLKRTTPGALQDTTGIADTLARKFIVRVTAQDTVGIDPMQALKMIFNRQMVEGVEIAAAYVSPSGSITTWAINTRNGAVTEYSNYNFNSFAKINNKYFGAADAGLYELTGDDDAGTDIIAQIKSGFAQFGGSRFTSFKAAYLGMRGEGDFVLKVETGDGKTYNYAVVGKDMQTTKVHMGKGLRARYFAFELISTGQDFDLDDIEFMPLVAQRRV